MSNRISDSPPPRFSVSQLPAEVDPVEKDFARLLTQALAPSFVLVKRLGAGGMGAVYLARDPLLRRLVAVKVLAPNLASDPAARARFEREGQAVAAISHPNVVNVHSVGELENGVPYIVMQYIEGPTLADHLKENGPLQARQAKHIIGEVASALAAAHKKGIIHRDIKPSNIILDEDTGRAMVTDFGIAAVKERDDKQPAADITQAGMAVGTPAYMSPEQLLAEPTTDKTDIYALGLLGYELFIAEGPYQVSSPKEIMAAHLRDTPRRLSTMRGDIAPELERLLEGCLAKDPAKRPTAAEVEKRLEHGAAILLEWPPPGLEKVRGLVHAPMWLMLIGSFAFAVPVVLQSVFDRESLVRNSLPPVMMLLAVAGIGFIAFAVGLIGVARFLVRAREAVAAGYGWGTLFETIADRRGDTGALITGAREYAELDPPRRNAMRRNRLVTLAFRFSAAFVPIVGWVFGVLFAARTNNGPTIVLWSSILLAVSLLAAARLIGSQEDRTMREPRRRLRSATAKSGAASTLAATWTESFEQVRTGQRMGAGPRWQGARGVRVAVAGVVTASLILGLVVFGLFTLTTLIGVAGEMAVPRFGNTNARIARLARLREYRVPTDSGITPLRAGQALHAISRNGPGGPLLRYEKQPAITIPPQPGTPTPPDPFPSTDGGWVSHAFRSARRGFTLPQGDFLRAMGDNSALEEFRLLARAPGLDLIAAFWDLSERPAPIFLPLPKFGSVKNAAYANTARAALDLAAGRTREAEQRLRENLNVGFLMIDDGHTIIENVMGSAIVSHARTALWAFYETTGRERDARFVSQQSDPEPIGVASYPTRMSLSEVQNAVRTMILDSTSILGLRWEMLTNSFAIEPCTDLHQVVFGPDSLHRATLEEARRLLVKRPSDSAYFALVEIDKVVPITAQGPRGRALRATRPISAATTFLTGNRQLESCLSLFGG